jgi:hypothetical protein
MNLMPRSDAVWLSAALLSCAALGCNRFEPCGVPGVVKLCPCGGMTQGARVCRSDKTWGSCDCSGAIALPKAISAGQGGSGGPKVQATGGASGGNAIARGTGGTRPPPQSGDDAGTEPMSHETGGNGGSSGGGGMGGGGGGGGGGGAQAEPMSAAYDGCMSANDCHPGAQCITTSSFPADQSVCAPACVDVGDCPVPEGKYEAVLTCVTSSCRLDCTPVLFAALLTCPSGMTCVAPLLGNAYCFDTP